MASPATFVQLLHVIGAGDWDQIWGAWNWDPILLFGLLLSAWTYTTGVQRLWRRAGRGRGISSWQAAAFWTGLLAIFLALLTPLDALSHSFISAHMVQHLLLMMVAAPLLAVSNPAIAVAWALPQVARQVGRWLRPFTSVRHSLIWPATVWLLYTGMVTIWHLPVFYEAAIRSELVHSIEHATFFGASFLFWGVVVTAGRSGGLGYAGALLFVVTAAMHGAAFAAIMTLAQVPWYSHYMAEAPAWGVSAIDDQQLAGAIMWIPGKIAHLFAVITLLLAWFRKAARQEIRDGRPEVSHHGRIPGEAMFQEGG
ncbi:MAG: cytochrome c oxidase assembly protein [Dehalococcoidia bacterium]